MKVWSIHLPMEEIGKTAESGGKFIKYLLVGTNLQIEPGETCFVHDMDLKVALRLCVGFVRTGCIYYNLSGESQVM